MKSIVIFTLSFLVISTGFSQAVGILPKRALTGAGIGSGIGRGAGQALSGWIDMKKSGQEFNARIAEARSKHWELYPDKPGYEAARVEFESLLLEKDIGLMMQRLLLPDQWDRSLDGSMFGETFKDLFIKQMGGGEKGGLDGGPLPGASRYLFRWTNQMKNSLGGNSDEVAARMLLNPSSFLQAFNQALPAYEAYLYARSFAEYVKAGRWADFYSTPESLLIDATRFREMATGGTITVSQASQLLPTSFELYGRELLMDAANVVRANRMAGEFIVQKNGEAGLPVSDTQENAILYLIGPELSPKQYALAMYRGLRAESDRIDDLPIVRDFGEEAVLAACREIQDTRLMPDSARRALRRILDKTKIDAMGDTVLRFERDQIQDFGIPYTTVDFAGGGNWVAINTREFFVRDAETGEVTVAMIAPARVRSAEINETHMLLGAYDGDRKEHLAFLFDVSTGELLHTLKSPTPHWRDHFGVDVALTERYAVVTGADPDRYFSDMETVVFDIETGEEVRTLPVAGRIATHDSRLVIVSNVFNAEGSFEAEPMGTVYDLDTGETVSSLDFTGVGVRDFNEDSRDAPHVFDVEMDEGIIAVYVVNAAPTGTVVSFDSTTGEQISKIVTGIEESKKKPQPFHSTIYSDNKMELVGERVLVRALTGGSEEEAHHVFNALSGRPLRSFVEFGSRIESYEGPLIFDGEHVVVRATRTLRVPLHQLEEDAKDWNPLDDPGIKKRIAQPNGQRELVLEAAQERERLRLIEMERLELERIAAAEARLDMSIFTSGERRAIDGYARDKFYNLPWATEERSRNNLENNIARYLRQHERLERLPELRLEIHAYKMVIEENKQYLDHSSYDRVKSAELLIGWLESKIERANRQIEAGLERDASEDLPRPLMGYSRGAAKQYAKVLLYDLPREERDNGRRQKIGLMENMIEKNPFIADIPEAHLRLLSAEAVIDKFGSSEESWGDNPYHDPFRRDLAEAREELPKLEAQWDAIWTNQSAGGLQPHAFTELIAYRKPVVTRPVVADDRDGGSGRRSYPRGPVDVVSPRPDSGSSSSRRDLIAELKAEKQAARKDLTRETRGVAQVVEADLGIVEFEGFQKALEIALSADQAELEEINKERAEFGIEPLDTYSRTTQWVRMAGGFWNLFAETADSEHFDNAKDSIYKIRGISSQFSNGLKRALPFVYGRFSEQQGKRTPIGDIQAAKVEEGSLDPSQTVMMFVSSERIDLLRDLNSAEDDLRSREIVVARQTQTKDLPERTLLSYQGQIESRRNKLSAAEQALASLDAALSEDG
ncbi:MAG: hypothetical protein AAGB46_04410 [Verrucomicrobiota bacterium]